MHKKFTIHCEFSDLFIAGFLHVKLLPTWAKSQKREIFFHSEINYELMAFTRLNVLYQQENMWLRRNVLVNRGSSDFFTLLLRA